jgi:hypothetical protein
MRGFASFAGDVGSVHPAPGSPPPLQAARSASSPPLPAPPCPSLRARSCAHALPLPPTQAASYVSRRRLDSEDFNPEAVDEEGLPLVYNEARIAAYWKGRPGELASRWAKFAGVSGEPQPLPSFFPFLRC